MHMNCRVTYRLMISTALLLYMQHIYTTRMYVIISYEEEYIFWPFIFCSCRGRCWWYFRFGFCVSFFVLCTCVHYFLRKSTRGSMRFVCTAVCYMSLHPAPTHCCESEKTNRRAEYFVHVMCETKYFTVVQQLYTAAVNMLEFFFCFRFLCTFPTSIYVFRLRCSSPKSIILYIRSRIYTSATWRVSQQPALNENWNFGVIALTTWQQKQWPVRTHTHTHVSALWVTRGESNRYNILPAGAAAAVHQCSRSTQIPVMLP